MAGEHDVFERPPTPAVSLEQVPVGMGARNSTGVGCLRAIKKSGPLADGRHRRMGVGDGSGVLEHHPRDALVGADPAGRFVDRILQTVLGVPSFMFPRPDIETGCFFPSARTLGWVTS